MKTDFIPYEQSLQLKQLGFNEPCFGYWKSKNWLIQEKTRTDGYTHADQECSAPTFSQAFRFFRDKLNFHHQILLDQTTQPKYCFEIYKYEDFGNYTKVKNSDWSLYRTYEEAQKECLIKLIEINLEPN